MLATVTISRIYEHTHISGASSFCLRVIALTVSSSRASIGRRSEEPFRPGAVPLGLATRVREESPLMLAPTALPPQPPLMMATIR